MSKLKLHAKLRLSSDRKKNKRGIIHFSKSLRGVYILCDEEMNPLYVGQSSHSIADRLLTHLGFKRGVTVNKYVKRVRRSIEYILLFKEEDEVKRAELEFSLIKKYQPFCNVRIAKDIIKNR